MKLAIVVGTRPEIIRLACIIHEASKYFETVLIHTGQNWDKNLKDIFFDQLKIRQPDYYLDVVGDHLGETMGNIIKRSYEIFQSIKPDCLLILGDTNSGLCAISAKRLKIPIFHMEAGNRCFDQNVPEEINRKLIDHISDVNLCYTINSKTYLLSEGFRKEHIFVTGTPLTEVLSFYKFDIETSDILSKLALTAKQYFVLSLHREENIDNPNKLSILLDMINTIAEKYKKIIIFSVHPRTKQKLNSHNIKLHNLVRIMDPLGLLDYCKLQINAYCVLSDSGSLSEESCILNFPAVSLRDSTERPEAVDKGNIVLGNFYPESVLNSINMAISFHKGIKPIPYDYMDTNISEKVLKIIQGYTPIINKVIWQKSC